MLEERRHRSLPRGSSRVRWLTVRTASSPTSATSRSYAPAPPPCPPALHFLSHIHYWGRFQSCDIARDGRGRGASAAADALSSAACDISLTRRAHLPPGVPADPSYCCDIRPGRGLRRISPCAHPLLRTPIVPIESAPASDLALLAPVLLMPRLPVLPSLQLHLLS